MYNNGKKIQLPRTEPIDQETDYRSRNAPFQPLQGKGKGGCRPGPAELGDDGCEKGGEPVKHDAAVIGRHDG